MGFGRVALSLLALAVLASPAAGDCTCRAKGVIAEQGEVVCLAIPEGKRLARCDKVLNNSSWTFLERPCPAPAVVGLSHAAKAVERLAAAPGPDAR